MEVLDPARTVFAISDYQRDVVRRLLKDMAFETLSEQALEKTEVLADGRGRLAVITRHPQGWRIEPRDRVARFVREWIPPPAAA